MAVWQSHQQYYHYLSLYPVSVITYPYIQWLDISSWILDWSTRFLIFSRQYWQCSDVVRIFPSKSSQPFSYNLAHWRCHVCRTISIHTNSEITMLFLDSYNLLHTHLLYARPRPAKPLIQKYFHLSRLMTKPTKWSVRSENSESSLCASWVAKDPLLLHVDSKNFDQTWRMPRLVRVFAWRTGNLIGFVVCRLISLHKAFVPSFNKVLILLRYKRKFDL